MKNENILNELIKINTAEDFENKLIIEKLYDLFSKKGFVTNIIEDVYTHKKCLEVIYKQPAIGFLMHTDTTNVGGKWTYNPYTLTEVGDKLIGLGICDMKGGMSAVISAILETDFNKLNKGFALYFTFDEQVSFDGINLLESRNIKFPKTLILPQATNLAPVIASKGVVECNLIFKGVEAHSANLDKGDNAILKCFECLLELKEFANKLAMERDSNFEIPNTSFNVSKINGGTAINKVAGDASLFFDFRTIKSSHHEQIIEKVKDLSLKYNAFHTVINNILPMKCDDIELINNIESLTGKKSTTTAMVSEGAFIEGSNILILGPGPNTSNEADEYISSFSYSNAIDVYKQLIKIYCI